MINNNTRLLVAVDVNSRFPKYFRDYLEKSILKTSAQVIFKFISGNSVAESKQIKGDMTAKYLPEMCNAEMSDVSITLSPEIHARSIRTLDISLDDIIWANSYLIVAPLYQKGPSYKVRSFLEKFFDPVVRQHLRRKTVSAMTVSARSDENHIDLLKNIYTQFMAHGSIVVPAGLSDEPVFVTSSNAYGYRQVIDERVDEDLVDRQIQRLVDVTSAISRTFRQTGRFHRQTIFNFA